MERRVLVAFDESSQAHAALAFALDTFPDATIVVLHVNDPREWKFGDGTNYGYYSQEDFERAQETAAELLSEATAVARDHERAIETVTETGRVSDTVVAYAEDRGIDHIVIGSHGRTGLSRFLLGSVAETVTRRSPVSVTVVREENGD
ncbi:MAG: universal stress protein [Haloarculaceae archaeon]